MTNNILDKLKVPATGLIITGILNLIFGALILISQLARSLGVLGEENIPIDEAQRAGYYFGKFAGIGIGFLSLILAPIIIFGAIKMMKGKSRGLALFASILAILPFTSCCFLLGAVFGIWSLIVLSKSDVKAIFQSN
jgi:hypothetical protein